MAETNVEIATCNTKCCTIQMIPYKKEDKISKYHPKRRKKAGGFIYDPHTQKILLVQSCGYLWGIPKGTFNPNETSIECAIREVKEETGLKISPEEFQRSICLRSQSIYYYLERAECPVSIQQHLTGNDANGIGWFNIKCLQQSILDGNICINQDCRNAVRKFLRVYLPKNKIFIEAKPKRKKNK